MITVGNAHFAIDRSCHFNCCYNVIKRICKSIKSANSQVNKVMGIFPFNRNKYARELNCRERYHTRELMSFHFIFVANFIRDKNPLYGISFVE